MAIHHRAYPQAHVFAHTSFHTVGAVTPSTAYPSSARLYSCVRPPYVDLAPRLSRSCAVADLLTQSQHRIRPPQHRDRNSPHISPLPATTASLAARMPLRSERPIVGVVPGSMHTIETHNAENLFGLWSGKCNTPKFG